MSQSACVCSRMALASRSRSLVSSCRQLECGEAAGLRLFSIHLHYPPPPPPPPGLAPKKNGDASLVVSVRTWSKLAPWQRAVASQCRLRRLDAARGCGCGGLSGGGEKDGEEEEEGDCQPGMTLSTSMTIGGKVSSRTQRPGWGLYDGQMKRTIIAVFCRTRSALSICRGGEWKLGVPSSPPPFLHGNGFCSLPSTTSMLSSCVPSSSLGLGYGVIRGRNGRGWEEAKCWGGDSSAGWKLSTRCSETRWRDRPLTVQSVSPCSSGKVSIVLEEECEQTESEEEDEADTLEEDRVERDEDDNGEEQGSGLIRDTAIKLRKLLDLYELEQQLEREEELDYGDSLHGSSAGEGSVRGEQKNGVVLGIDPDVSGAIAVLRTDGNGMSAEVLDLPSVKVKVGTRFRKRHDVQAIVQLVSTISAPKGTLAFIEQTSPFPKDGKQGWFSSGFGYGAWLGVLLSAGCTVMPVRASSWKKSMGIFGRDFTKDDSRAVAAELFPSVAVQLKRKKDHGRAEALLIAAFGKGLSKNSKVCTDQDN